MCDGSLYIIKIINKEEYWVRIKVNMNCKSAYILTYPVYFYDDILGNILCLVVSLTNESIEE